MGWRMVKQPNGAYARWSDVVDAFTHLNLSRRQALEVCRESLGSLEAEQKVKRADIDAGEADQPGPPLSRWKECLESMRALGKKKEAAEAEKEDRQFPHQLDPEPKPLKLDKLAIMYSAPQTLICTEDGGQGIATCHGNNREERERVAQWLVAQVDGFRKLKEQTERDRLITESEAICAFCKVIYQKTDIETHITTCEAHPLFKLRLAVTEALHVIEPVIEEARMRGGEDPNLRSLARPCQPAIDKLTALLKGTP